MIRRRSAGRPSPPVLLLVICGLIASAVGPTVSCAAPGMSGQLVAATSVEPFGPEDLVPVVLVHGLGGSAASTWGAPSRDGARPSGMYLALCQAGYVPGRTLFACDYAGDNLGDYRAIAQRYLPGVIDQAVAASGRQRVDIISRSMGGLVARAYVTSPGYRGDVRTLVMIATPSRGSFGANIVRAVEMINLQEQLRDRAAGHQRRLQPAVIPAAGDLFTQFRDEVQYVGLQSTRLWEPLFAEYYCSAWLLAERDVASDANPPDFLRWLKSRYGYVYDAVVAAGQPPLTPSYVVDGTGFTGAIPGSGESLTRAYYEAVALQCARHNFFLAFGGQPGEALPPAPPATLVERLVGWFTGVVARLAGKLARDHGQGLLLWAMEHIAGIDPKARAAECLVEEQFRLSLGGPVALPTGMPGQSAVFSGAAPATEPNLCGNYYLATWNAADEAARRSAEAFGAVLDQWPPGVRYVSIAGQVPNVWSRLWPDVGPNDLAVETSSAYLPLSENDAFHLLPSLVATNHVAIGGTGKALAVLLSSLRDYYPIKASYGPAFVAGRSAIKEYRKSGTVKAETYTPGYLELLLPSAYGAASVRLGVLDVAKAPAGIAAWAYLAVPGAGIRRYPLSFTQSAGGRLEASVTVPAPGVTGARLLVGVRALAGAGTALPPSNSSVPLSWQLSYLPEELATSMGLLAPAGSGGDPALPGTGPQSRQGAAGASTGSTGSYSSLAPAAIPVIQATHRDKQTTSLQPCMTRHVRWEWDFGDGATYADDDPARTKIAVDHEYPCPGRYVCRARSVGAHGEVLAEHQWIADLSGDPRCSQTFNATTLPWAEVDLELVGPLAWVTGLPAEYTVRYDLRLPPGTPQADYQVRIEPAERFEMLWHKPGEFTVTAALVLQLRYDSGQGRATITNVYTVEQQVEVYATVVTD